MAKRIRRTSETSAASINCFTYGWSGIRAGIAVPEGACVRCGGQRIVFSRNDPPVVSGSTLIAASVFKDEHSQRLIGPVPTKTLLVLVDNTLPRTVHVRRTFTEGVVAPDLVICSGSGRHLLVLENNEGCEVYRLDGSVVRLRNNDGKLMRVTLPVSEQAGSRACMLRPLLMRDGVLNIAAVQEIARMLEGLPTGNAKLVLRQFGRVLVKNAGDFPRLLADEVEKAFAKHDEVLADELAAAYKKAQPVIVHYRRSKQHSPAAAAHA